MGVNKPFAQIGILSMSRGAARIEDRSTCLEKEALVCILEIRMRCIHDLPEDAS